MLFSVQRSPAKVCWWVVFNDVILHTTDTRYEAIALAGELTRKYN